MTNNLYVIVSAILLLIIFPVISFRYNLATPIFPALEIIIIYYYSSLKNIRLEYLFIICILLDQFYYLPTGTYGVSFLIANSLLYTMRQWLKLANNTINCLVFFAYALIVLWIKYVIFKILDKEVDTLELIFQYFTTILAYPSIKAIFDKLLASNEYQQNSSK